ncbi:glycosyltransferase [Algibacter lectus]|uniref:Glycosyltransferase n=1 Tax=Algibacter lectus TaxID=221126 RepID=A0A090WUV5_9FLAO|nr:hypothetical protein [Algibacter lectus]GAL80910.1 glycosyltransferase [Algibacter lectus]
MKNHKVAILIFANSAEKEMVSKPLSSTSGLFEALNLQTINIAKKTGLPYFHLGENNKLEQILANVLQTPFNLFTTKDIRPLLLLGMIRHI